MNSVKEIEYEILQDMTNEFLNSKPHELLMHVKKCVVSAKPSVSKEIIHIISECVLYPDRRDFLYDYVQRDMFYVSQWDIALKKLCEYQLKILEEEDSSSVDMNLDESILILKFEDEVLTYLIKSCVDSLF